MFCEYLTGVCLRHFHFIKLKNFLYCIHTICITHYMYTINTYYHLLVIIHHSCQNDRNSVTETTKDSSSEVRPNQTGFRDQQTHATLATLVQCLRYSVNVYSRQSCSSVPSAQSRSPSQCHSLSIHWCSCLQRNSSTRQDLFWPAASQKQIQVYMCVCFTQHTTDLSPGVAYYPSSSVNVHFKIVHFITLKSNHNSGW